jgi:hypothetical protein
MARRKRKTSYRFSLSMFLVNRTSKVDRRRRRRIRRSKNHWRTIDKLTYSKILITDIERVWLELNAPTATITYERAPKYKESIAYRKGYWHGYVYVVRFPESISDKAITFKHTWWNKKCL